MPSGYLIQVYKDGNVVCNVQIENGNIMQWSKFQDGNEVWKIHTYDSNLNVGGVHAIAAEGIRSQPLAGGDRTFRQGMHQSPYFQPVGLFVDRIIIYLRVRFQRLRSSVEHKLYGSDEEKYFYTYIAE